MDECLNVERQIERVLGKFGVFNEYAESTLTELIDDFQDLQKEFLSLDKDQPLTEAQVIMLTNHANRVKAVVTSMANKHKQLHKTVSRVGKVVDKNFIKDYATTDKEDVFQNPENIKSLNQAICDHFLLEGIAEIADEFIMESGLQMEQGRIELFIELYRILHGLKKKDVQPALEWACRNRQKLKELNSSLEFQLHRMHFIHLLQQRAMRPEEAVSYARQNFQHVASQHEKDIQLLMGTIPYLRQGVQNSPYSYLLDPTQWDQIYDIFIRNARAVIGLPSRSPLAVCIDAGCIAQPALQSKRQVEQQRHAAGASARDELQVSIDLGRHCYFHSTFVCPILRQQTSEDNPPMRLTCGHVISREALLQLENDNKLKCPYCPVEQNVADARVIHF